MKREGRSVSTQEKDLNYYLNLRYPITLYPAEEGGYVAEVRDLPGCLTQGETLPEVFELIEDAKRGWLELALETGGVIPEPMPDSYSGRFVVRLPKTLHRQLAEAAANEGVSLNQFVLALLAGGLTPTLHLNRGSNTSRKPSRSRLNPTTVRKIATAGRAESITPPGSSALP